MISRRKLVAGGGIAATSLLSAATGAGAAEMSQDEAVIRAWYALWATSKTWAPFDAILTDDFTFSSANGEDHISKAEFKTECWDNQIGHTQGFDLKRIMTDGDHAFVEYVGHTYAGNTFHNVEIIQVRDGRIANIVCFFGGKATFPSAVDSHKA